MRRTLEDVMKIEPGSLREHFGLSHQEMRFVTEYIKDYSPRRAAEAANYAPDSGYQLKEKGGIKQALDYIAANYLCDGVIDAEWILYELADNHRIARQAGNLSASNQALNLLAKHKRVDAYAAEKLKVTTDSDVAERLMKARSRVQEGAQEGDSETSTDVSFL